MSDSRNEPGDESQLESTASISPEPDHAWKALGTINEWIRHAETKAGIVLAAAGVTGGALYNLVAEIDQPSSLASVLIVFCGIAVLGVGGCAAAALIPRHKVNGSQSSSPNLLFYLDIASTYKTGDSAYAAGLSALTSDNSELTRHLASQIRANSIVAHRKFLWTDWAIRALVVALLALGVIAAVV